jgi:hypothetical protein
MACQCKDIVGAKCVAMCRRKTEVCNFMEFVIFLN